MSPLWLRCRCQRFGLTSVSDGRDSLAAEVLFLLHFRVKDKYVISSIANYILGLKVRNYI